MKSKEKHRRWLYLGTAFLVSLVFVIPLWMMLLGSFKNAGEVLHLDLSFPARLEFQNYIHVIETGNILRGYLNSALVTAASVIFVLLCGSMTGILISRRKDKTAGGIYYFFLFGLTATTQMATTYAMMVKMHLTGTYIGVILVFTAMRLPFAIMTYSSFVTGVPREIDEAALIDGAGPIALIFNILMPILKPVTVTNLIIASIGIWNNFQIPLYLMSSSEKMTIPMTVFNFYGLYARDWNYVFAALTITMLPVVVLYLCLQKHIIGGMTAGAVKG